MNNITQNKRLATRETVLSKSEHSIHSLANILFKYTIAVNNNKKKNTVLATNIDENTATTQGLYAKTNQTVTIRGGGFWDAGNSTRQYRVCFLCGDGSSPEHHTRCTFPCDEHNCGSCPTFESCEAVGNRNRLNRESRHPNFDSNTPPTKIQLIYVTL